MDITYDINCILYIQRFFWLGKKMSTPDEEWDSWADQSGKLYYVNRQTQEKRHQLPQVWSKLRCIFLLGVCAMCIQMLQQPFFDRRASKIFDRDIHELVSTIDLSKVRGFLMYEYCDNQRNLLNFYDISLFVSGYLRSINAKYKLNHVIPNEIEILICELIMIYQSFV